MFNKIILSSLIILLGHSVQAQNLTEQDWSTEADFRKDEPVVLENILWLEDHPLSTATNDTKAISAYILNWLSNSPYLTVKYDELFLAGLTNSKKYKFGEKFRVTYLFGKSYFILTQPNEEDEAKACARGIEGMVKVYQELKKTDPSVRNKMLEKFSRLVRKNTIEAYTRDALSKSNI